MIVLSIFLACGPPADPTHPGDSKPAQNAQAFLDALAAHDDAAAYAMLAYPESYPDFSQENFGRRAEYLGLRQGSEKWLSVTYYRPKQEEWLYRQIEKMNHVSLVKGELSNGKLLVLKENDGKLSSISVNDALLTDIVESRIIPLPPPLPGPAPIRDLTLSWDNDTLKLTGQATFNETQASFALNSRCKVGERWLRNAMTFDRQVPAAGTHPLALQHRITASSTCEVMVQMSQAEGRRQSRMCLDHGQLQDGPCPEQPTGTPEPAPLLHISDVRADNLSSAGVTISSLVLANQTPPAHAARENASLRTELRCADGQRFEHGRPINADGLLAGESRRLGAVFVEALVTPCEVHQISTHSDPYSDERVDLWEGCLDMGVLLPESCAPRER